jgi:hypothetical protein
MSVRRQAKRVIGGTSTDQMARRVLRSLDVVSHAALLRGA